MYREKRLCLQGDEALFANMKLEHQRWPEMPLILGRSRTQYVAMVTKLLRRLERVFCCTRARNLHQDARVS